MRVESEARVRLLELAVGVIDESGEPGIRVNQLAEQAGVTVPTLYHHFGNREGLIEEAQAERFIRQIREDVEVLVSALGTCCDADELRTALGALFARRDTTEGSRRRLQRLNALGAAYARPRLGARIAQTSNEIATRVAVALAPFQRQGILRTDVDLRAMTAWYVGASLGKVLLDFEGNDVDPHEWERLMNEATLNLLFPAQR